MIRSTTHLTAAVALGLVVVAACFAAPANTTKQQNDATTSDQTKPTIRWDLDQPAYDPPNCPAWVKVPVPANMRPYMGKNGLPAPWGNKKAPLATSVQGIDRYQANHFIVYRKETADFLYSDYTPTSVDYKAGLLPSYEAVVNKYTNDQMTDTEKALALLTQAMPNVFRHPTMPPIGQSVTADRNLADEALLKSGCGWCNEQARVFIRLCQVAGMQGRMIHLFGQNHTITEFYADGRWVLADASNFFVARDKEGNLLSAADCHDGGAGQLAYAKAKKKRLMELAAMSDEALNLPHGKAERFRAHCRSFDVEALANRDDLVFGVINYPLPSATTSSAAQ